MTEHWINVYRFTDGSRDHGQPQTIRSDALRYTETMRDIYGVRTLYRLHVRLKSPA